MRGHNFSSEIFAQEKVKKSFQMRPITGLVSLVLVKKYRKYTIVHTVFFSNSFFSYFTREFNQVLTQDDIKTELKGQLQFFC